MKLGIRLGLERRSGTAGLYGPELLTNPSFTADADWTKGTGWSITDGYAQHVAGELATLDQAFAFSVGAVYRVEFSILETTGALGVQPRFIGGTTTIGSMRNTVGTHVQFLTAQTGNVTFALVAAATTAAKIGSVSLRRVL